MADQIVVMHGGRVEQVGAPLDLYDRPANLFVAGFIGSPGDELPAGHGRGAAPVRDRRHRLAAAAGGHAPGGGPPSTASGRSTGA